MVSENKNGNKMILTNAIKKIEKAYGKLNKNDNGQFWLHTKNNKSISFYENGIGSNTVYTFYVNGIGDDTGYNGRNGIYCDTLKHALSWLSR